MIIPKRALREVFWSHDLITVTAAYSRYGTFEATYLKKITNLLNLKT